MGAGIFQKIQVSVASGATLSPAADIGLAAGAMYLSVPSMTSNSQIYVQGSPDGTTFRRITQPIVNTSTIAAPNDFIIASAATNRIVPIPGGFRYLKVETTATMDSGQAFSIIYSSV